MYNKIFFVIGLLFVLGPATGCAGRQSGSLIEASTTTPTISPPLPTTPILLTKTTTPKPATETPTPTGIIFEPDFSHTQTIIFPRRSSKLGDTLVRSADGMTMVYVPAGGFEMGSSQSQIADALKYCDPHITTGECPQDLFDNESPQHPVNLDGFWIDQTEVRYSQYQDCIAAGVCSSPQCAVPESFNHHNQPVSCITWHDASNYCHWVGGRLPSEAEWEYADRGPDGNIFPWGETFDPTRLNFCDIQCLAGWKDQDYDDGFPFLAPPSSFPNGASWCGAMDMAGNALEWVADWYGENYDTTSMGDNPLGPESGNARVIRGGAANQILSYARAAWRSSAVPSQHYDFLGFRCAASAPDQINISLQDTPTPDFTSTPEVVEAVDLETRDGLPLAGWLNHPTVPKEKPVAVILAHQLSSSHFEWRDFVDLLTQNGYTALAFDFRGQGRSPGVLDYSSVGIDVDAAIRFLQSRGYDRIVCMGASMGGSGCLAAAVDSDLEGIVNLSGPVNIPGTRLVTAENLANLEIPKLFMIADGDTIPDWPTFVDDFVEMYQRSAEPKALIRYPGQAHGTGLFREEYGEEVLNELLDFLNKLSPTPTSTPSPSWVYLEPLNHQWQTLNNCHRASIATLLGYYDIWYTQNDFHEGMDGLNDLISPHDLTSRIYLVSYALIPSSEAVRWMLAEGIPVIAGQNVSADDPTWHYRVIRGYDDALQEFLVDDPLLGPDHRIAYQEFNQLSRGDGQIIPVYPIEKDEMIAETMKNWQMKLLVYP